MNASRYAGDPSAATPAQAVSVIVPTIGRPASLARLLASLANQTAVVQEVIVADASGTSETDVIISEPRWLAAGLRVRRIVVSPPNAVRQRQAAIDVSKGDFLLMLDDDVVLEPACVQQMLSLLQSNPKIVGVTADFNNQTWSQPTPCWYFYLRHVLRLPVGAWQGKVIGPLLRFGYNPVPACPQPMQWLGSGNSLVRRSAYFSAGGFSDFFLYRCTINEDVDLGIKLARVGAILFCPAARMAHHHAPGGRVSMAVAAEDDLYNRFLVLRRTCGKSVARALGLVGVFMFIETTSHFLGCVKRVSFIGFFPRLYGRLRGTARVLLVVSAPKRATIFPAMKAE
jgi:GT2 family glycosyltransferase